MLKSKGLPRVRHDLVTKNNSNKVSLEKNPSRECSFLKLQRGINTTAKFPSEMNPLYFAQATFKKFSIS